VSPTRRQGACLIAIAAAGLYFNTPAVGQISEPVLERQISGYANDLCGNCHHEPGSKRELAPRISGQKRDYIEAQLNAFRHKSRSEPEVYDCMWGLSSALSDGLVAALAGYFASQVPFPGIPGDPDLIGRGRVVFNRSGDPGGAPSCVRCHGKNAEGDGAIPRLAAQLGPYLNRQLHVIRAKFRSSGAMHGAVQNLSDDEMYWLAVYL
jgi:cytochrome c553